MPGFNFNPSTISVGVGDTVNWTDVASGTHTVTAIAGQAESWNSGRMTYGESFSHNFTIPGTYVYTSTVDSDLTGKVVVANPVPEFPGLLVFATLGLAIFVGLAFERTLRRSFPSGEGS